MFIEEEHPRDKDGKFTENGKGIGKSKSTEKDNNSQSGIKYGKDIKLDIDERGSLRKVVFDKYADRKNRKDEDYAYTANYFYIYKVYDFDSFTPLVQVFIDGNKNTINQLIKKWRL